jgi:hypothetical protein
MVHRRHRGRCLTRTASIHGSAASKEEAVALAEAMVRDGRMPSPAEAKAAASERRAEADERRTKAEAKAERQRLEARAEAMVREGRASTLDEARALLLAFKAEREAEWKAAAEAARADAERRRIARDKRASRPAEQKRQAEREARQAERNAERAAKAEAFYRRMEAERREREAQPLHEVLDEAFDLADPDLWKSNSFAALKPRLILHVEAAIARLAYEDISYTWRDDKARLDRAKAIYHKLTGAEWAPRLSKMSQLMARLANMTAAAPERLGADSAGEEARHE